MPDTASASLAGEFALALFTLPSYPFSNCFSTSTSRLPGATNTVPCSAAGMFHSRPWKISVSLQFGAGRLDLRVDQVDADPRMGGAAVVGDDEPVQPVRRGVASLVDDAVHAVGAQLRVDVVIAGQPHVRPVAVPEDPPVLGRRRGRELRTGHGERRRTPENPGRAQQPPPRNLRRRQVTVRDRLVQRSQRPLIQLDIRLMVIVRVRVPHRRSSPDGIAAIIAFPHDQEMCAG